MVAIIEWAALVRAKRRERRPLIAPSWASRRDYVTLTNMSSINIGGSSKDASYRYKMPKLIAKVEGRGNGIKTRIVNMAEIAKCLKVPPAYPTKWFGFELGAQARWTEKTQAAIVNGAFTAADLQSTLDAFVQTFVLCPNCGLPEIDLSVKRNVVMATCSACGNQASIGGTHKLSKYIVNNPPPKSKKGASKQAAAAAAAADDADPFAGDIIDVTKTEVADDDANVEWFTDTSEAAVLDRQKATIGANKLLADIGAVTIERDIADSVAAFEAWYAESDRDLGEIEAFLDDLKSTYAHKNAEIVGAFCAVVWGDDLFTQLPHYAEIMSKFINGTSEQKVVLGWVERVCGETHRDALLKYVAHILKHLYELDLVDEEVMLKWAGKKSSKFVLNKISVEVKTAGAQFLDWLAEADDEYSYEDDDEDDGEDAGASQVTERFARGAAAAPVAANDDDDDFDIDDI
ncbi:eukaryotic translation initiation factor 5 [Thecamonas trahens ATCC 50062]|uniref:Eukaryotic translation initiation factor 5 n=1 Tax=Thecamonas trahens ATCC 50062 TaxID=461836 RepID=A0A0L0DJ32_THETB|nr:eukaryotic translation initiation factor 5 [Thecamonas trahens ATCC 50062]KNC52409.1 eukaryotic translation initiation factor 5 [Thecamonas trahens ATCC 50062]|eukprot:XP_013755452.1 eukaryotic translation initiation factor 5 [Thecamonas trahens ATCC 50062]